MKVSRLAPCKVNLLLTILGKRLDGFHELETLLYPIPIHDELEIERSGVGISLECDAVGIPRDPTNLSWKAAEAFRARVGAFDGVRIRLVKHLPVSAGLGGGSSDAAHTLLGLNELFGFPLSREDLTLLASKLGSDVPFFLDGLPAIGVGRGEIVTPQTSLNALEGAAIVLCYPSFGVSTAWAYKALARFPASLSGVAGGAAALVTALRDRPLPEALSLMHNSLEPPVFEKYPLIQLAVETMRREGAVGSLMSGSGSTAFGICSSLAAGERLGELMKREFGRHAWVATASIPKC